MIPLPIATENRYKNLEKASCLKVDFKLQRPDHGYQHNKDLSPARETYPETLVKGYLDGSHGRSYLIINRFSGPGLRSGRRYSGEVKAGKSVRLQRVCTLSRREEPAL
jgi:hypothetical protein